MQFGNWNEAIHEDVDQIKRLGSAVKIKEDTVELSDDGESALMYGRTGGEYHVWLDECECYDFAVHQKPCKHIYRLAIELGLIELPKIKKVNKKEFEQAIATEIDRYREIYLNGGMSLDKFVKICTALLAK